MFVQCPRGGSSTIDGEVGSWNFPEWMYHPARDERSGGDTMGARQTLDLIDFENLQGLPI